MVLDVLYGIAVNFRDQKFADQNYEKVEKCVIFFMYHFVPHKSCKTASHVPIK